MQLNFSDNSSRFTKAFRVFTDFIKSAVSTIGGVLVGSAILYGLFLFGKIIWVFLQMFLKALGQL